MERRREERILIKTVSKILIDKECLFKLFNFGILTLNGCSETNCLPSLSHQ